MHREKILRIAGLKSDCRVELTDVRFLGKWIKHSRENHKSRISGK